MPRRLTSTPAPGPSVEPQPDLFLVVTDEKAEPGDVVPVLAAMLVDMLDRERPKPPACDAAGTAAAG
jgi:hypothetical protein